MQQFKKAVIVFHEATTGPAHDLRNYLLDQKIKELLFIAHPLLYLKDGYKKSSHYDFYKNGKLVESKIAFHWRMPESFLYVKDTMYTLYWFLKKGKGSEFFFGVGNLNAFVGIILKFFGFKQKVIYYVIDYVPKRFQNRIVNDIYHFIERLSARYADFTWNLSPRMIIARAEKWKMEFNNQMVVPHGVHYNRIKRVEFSMINKSEMIYMGSLLKKQGIQLVIIAMPELIKIIPTIKFTIIGTGPYESELKDLVKKFNLQNYVDFLGYLPDHSEMENRIAMATVAIALYNKKYDEFSYYADPGKVKNYLGSGVPVIMTDIPYVASQVKKENCGFVIPYSKKALIDVVSKIMLDHKLLKEYRSNALKFAKRNEWSLIFDNAFKKINNIANIKYE